MSSSNSTSFEHTRILMILEAARRAGISPLPAEVFHSIAYFSNILAPIYNIRSIDGKILRLKKGPYYPDLQTQLDWLVLCGLVNISNMKYQYIYDINNWRLFADYEVNNEKVKHFINKSLLLQDEKKDFEFIFKVSIALSELSNSEISISNEIDATYSDNATDYGNVIDYAEWVSENPSTNAIKLIHFHFSKIQFTDEAEISFYVRHLLKKIKSRNINS